MTDKRKRQKGGDVKGINNSEWSPVDSAYYLEVALDWLEHLWSRVKKRKIARRIVLVVTFLPVTALVALVAVAICSWRCIVATWEEW